MKQDYHQDMHKILMWSIVYQVSRPNQHQNK
jgi:hypothetical protein